MTGAELYKVLELKADVAYSGYVSNSDANRFFLNALTNEVSNLYNNHFNIQNTFDEISYLIATGQQYNINPTTNSMYLGDHTIPITQIWNVGTAVTVTTTLPHDLIPGTRVKFINITSSAGNLTQLNGQIYVPTIVDAFTFTFTSSFTIAPTGTFLTGEFTCPDAVPQYQHLLRGEAQFTDLTPFTVVASTNATPIMITLNTRSYLRDRDQVVITGIGGNTNANGTFFLKYANEFNYFLYTDFKLQNPVSGNGIQTGTGTVSQIIKSTLRFKRSDEKGSSFGKPTVQSPFYQQSFNLIKVLPDDEPCSWIKLDYIRKPTFDIDVANNTDDLDNFYPKSFQYAIIDQALKIFAESTRDMILYSESEQSIRENP